MIAPNVDLMHRTDYVGQEQFSRALSCLAGAALHAHLDRHLFKHLPEITVDPSLGIAFENPSRKAVIYIAQSYDIFGFRQSSQADSLEASPATEHARCSAACTGFQLTTLGRLPCQSRVARSMWRWLTDATEYFCPWC